MASRLVLARLWFRGRPRHRPAWATTIHVPADRPTIQLALDAGASIPAGTYFLVLEPLADRERALRVILTK